MGSLALEELPAAAIGNSVEALDRKNDFGIVVEQQIVSVEFHFDRIEHVHRVPFVGADQANEITMAV